MESTKNRKFLILSTLVCLSPILMYLAVYNQLPDYMVQHWGAGGTPTWSAPKHLAIFITPVMLAVINLIVATLMNSNSAVQKNPKKVQQMVLWLVPIISVFVNLGILLANLDTNFDIMIASLAFVGLLLIIIGNYLPKTRQNYLIGVRVSWTLNDADNWNKTHRLAGKTCILAGFLLLIGAVLPHNQSALTFLLISILILVAVIPITYSYILHRQSKNLD